MQAARACVIALYWVNGAVLMAHLTGGFDMSIGCITCTLASFVAILGQERHELTRDGAKGDPLGYLQVGAVVSPAAARAGADDASSPQHAQLRLTLRLF